MEDDTRNCPNCGQPQPVPQYQQTQFKMPAAGTVCLIAKIVALVLFCLLFINSGISALFNSGGLFHFCRLFFSGIVSGAAPCAILYLLAEILGVLDRIEKKK